MTRGRPTALCTEYQLLGLTQAEFNRLVVEHGDVLYRMAYRLMGDAHDAEDVVQDTFRSVWKSRERFEHGRGDRAWLTSILRRRSADRWRKSDYREQTLGDDLPEPAD